MVTWSKTHLGLREILFLIFPLIFAGAGVMLIAVGITSYKKTKSTESWSTTTGTVRSSGIRRHNDEGTIKYAPEVDYQYSVDGQQYMSSVIRSEIFVHFNDENEARQFLRGYPPESKILVYYNPDNPKESVLQAKAAPVLHFVTMLGALFCSFALIIYYSYYRSFKARRNLEMSL
jgi:hypothetical protein